MLGALNSFFNIIWLFAKQRLQHHVSMRSTKSELALNPVPCSVRIVQSFLRHLCHLASKNLLIIGTVGMFATQPLHRFGRSELASMAH